MSFCNICKSEKDVNCEVCSLTGEVSSYDVDKLASGDSSVVFDGLDDGRGIGAIEYEAADPIDGGGLVRSLRRLPTVLLKQTSLFDDACDVSCVGDLWE
jgi:hypothetical protein